MFIYLNKKAQGTAEYAIVLGLIVAVVVAMQTYVKRGLQGRVKDAVDYVDQGDQQVFKTSQYEPYYLQSNFSNDQNVEQRERMEQGGAVTRDVTDNRSRQGSQVIGGVQEE